MKSIYQMIFENPYTTAAVIFSILGIIAVLCSQTVLGLGIFVALAIRLGWVADKKSKKLDQVKLLGEGTFCATCSSRLSRVLGLFD